MGKMFPIVIIAVAIIGFSSSAYFFSQTTITIESPITMEVQNNNSVMQEIESCIEQNLAGSKLCCTKFIQYKHVTNSKSCCNGN